MNIVLPGGSGQIGSILARALAPAGHQITILCRDPSRIAPHLPARLVAWDGRNLGPWVREIDGADVVINLAGRTVNCRYTEKNLRQMMDSRVDSTRIVGQAITNATRPPRIWLQMSTATIYAHRFDAANDEYDGRIGGGEADAPAYWKYSIDIAQAWEREQHAAHTPATRRVALRTAMVMSPDAGGVLSVLLRLVRLGLGGAIAGGEQYLSWIHHQDFVRAIEFLIAHEELEGAVNICSPHPLPQGEFMCVLREAWGKRLGLPATAWMVRLGAAVIGTDAELVLKSRRVVPRRLSEAGFSFALGEWPMAAKQLVEAVRHAPHAL